MEQEMQALIYKFPQNYKNHNPQCASFAIRDAHYCGCWTTKTRQVYWQPIKLNISFQLSSAEVEGRKSV